MPRKGPSLWEEGLAGPVAAIGIALLVLLARLVSRSRGDALSADGGMVVARPASLSVVQVGVLGLACLTALVLGAWLLARRGRQLRPGPLGGARRAGLGDLKDFRRHHGTGARVRLGTHRWASVNLPLEDHLMVLGPTGSGKSSGLAIPAILEWPGAVVVTDPKGELLKTTVAARKRMGQVAVFAPLMRPSDAWNPITAIHSSEDALRVAGFLMGKAPEREPFWHDLAHQLLQGLLVEAATTGMSLGDTVAMLQSVPAEELPAEVGHPVARRLVQGATCGGDRTAMSVVATLMSKMAPYATDKVAQATGSSSFDPADLGRENLRTVYCLVTPHDAPLLRGVVSALLSSCWRAIYQSPPAKPVLFVLDEFAQLTLLPELPALVQLGRSQGVRMMLMAQDLSSIAATYGHATSTALWANCRTKLLLSGISEIELLDRVSRLVGSTTVHRQQSHGPDEPVSSHPLIAPDEVRRLRDDRALLLRGSGHPAVIQQRRWYRDRRLRALVELPLDPGEVPRPVAGRPLSEWTDTPETPPGHPPALPWSSDFTTLEDSQLETPA
jgi:type IV secretory pathway TraG/TraD family ATPase VirD4